MRFVIADLDGRSHAYFDLRGEARGALCEMEEDDPGSTDELYVVAYDDGERVWGPESADEVLRSQDFDWAGMVSGPVLTTQALAKVVGPFTAPAARPQGAEADTPPPAVPA